MVLEMVGCRAFLGVAAESCPGADAVFIYW